MAILNYFPSGGGSSGIDIGDATITLASSSFTYDGTEKTQAITSVTYSGTTLVENTDYIIIPNSNKGTNAGTYTLSIAGAGSYSGIKTATWSIAKATGSISAEQTVINNVNNIDGVVYDRLSIIGDGAVSASSSDTNCVVCGIDSTYNDLYVYCGGYDGTATVTVTLSSGQNYTGASCTITVSAFYIKDRLLENTPEKIKYAAQKGVASTLWDIGDQADAISITKFQNMTVDASFRPFIIGFDHNSSIEGTGITFLYGQTISSNNMALIDSGYGVNKYGDVSFFNIVNGDNNSCGWENSRMRTVTCANFYNALPSDWKNAISATTKYTNNSGRGTNNVTATSDYVFILAEFEVFGTNSLGRTEEGQKQQCYSYFSNGNSKVFQRHDTQSGAIKWWLRTNGTNGPGGNNSVYYFCLVNTNGAVSYDYTSTSLGFVPAFRVG